MKTLICIECFQQVKEGGGWKASNEFNNMKINDELTRLVLVMGVEEMGGKG